LKCRITYSLAGTAYGIPAGDGGLSLRRGQIVDLPAADVADLVQRGHAELTLTGEPGRPLRPSAEDLARVEAALAAEKPSPLSELRNQLKRSKTGT
jgi:hypothetical protein